MQLFCDSVLEEPLQALLEAFQRRHALHYELICKEPAQDPDSFFAEHPDGDLLLTVENPSSFLLAPSVYASAAIIARLQPVVLTTATLSERFDDLNVLRELRLALPDSTQFSLGRQVAALLGAEHCSWPELRQRAVFRSDDGEALARALALGRAEAAILWQANALQFISVAKIVPLPNSDEYAAELTMLPLKSLETKPELAALCQFLQGSWAKEIFAQYGYQLH